MRLTRRNVRHVTKGRRASDAQNVNLPPAPFEEGELINLSDYVDDFDVEVYEAPEVASALPVVALPLDALDIDVSDAVRVLSVVPEDGQYRVVTTGPQPGLRVQFYVTPDE